MSVAPRPVFIKNKLTTDKIKMDLFMENFVIFDFATILNHAIPTNFTVPS